MEGEAKILLTLKEMATSCPKSYYDHEFQNAVLSLSELQKDYVSPSDHIRASHIFVELRRRMKRSQVTREQFFEKLHEIFPPTIGSTNYETGPDFIDIAYQASIPRFDPPRSGGRRENPNPQFGRRNLKTTSDEPSPEIKLLQDLKSENGNMRALLTLIVDHLGINTGRKRKGPDDVNQQAKTHAAFRANHDPKGLNGKIKKSTKKVATPMPRYFVNRENSTASESSGNESPVHQALFARTMDPMPKLSVQSIFGPKSRPVLDESKPR
jgi:hypothetical protein